MQLIIFIVLIFACVSISRSQGGAKLLGKILGVCGVLFILRLVLFNPVATTAIASLLTLFLGGLFWYLFIKMWLTLRRQKKSAQEEERQRPVQKPIIPIRRSLTGPKRKQFLLDYRKADSKGWK